MNKDEFKKVDFVIHEPKFKKPSKWGLIALEVAVISFVVGVIFLAGYILMSIGGF